MCLQPGGQTNGLIKAYTGKGNLNPLINVIRQSCIAAEKILFSPYCFQQTFQRF